MRFKTKVARCLVDLEVENPTLYKRLLKNPFNYRAKDALYKWLVNNDSELAENIKPLLFIFYRNGLGSTLEEELRRN